MNRFWSILFILVPLFAFVTLILACFEVVPLSMLGLPASITASGKAIDFLFRLVHALCAGVLLITSVAIAWSVWKSETNAPIDGNYARSNILLELTWTLIPGALLLWLAYYQLDVWTEARLDPPTEVIGQQTVAMRPIVLVKARQYGWEFHYAGKDQKIRTADDVYVENLLVVPADRDVVMELESRDVIHSFFVPELRLKQDIVPGMQHRIWFNAKPDDELEVLCTELCGEGHYRMRAKMRVVGQDEFSTWLERKAKQKQPNDFAVLRASPLDE
jgi:cytochrome c oxidase subunit 2